jgi:NAD(P)H-quinone oxidoreductase subunit 5
VALSSWAGSLEFSDLYRWIDTAQLAPLPATLLGLGLIAGPMGKCAQFPMHLWLDEAMEGPNPASILRNSAVVTCGALVLLKLMPLLRLSPVAIDVLLVVGTISALGGALVAIAQVDLKRTFSYGTTSYLGLVFLAIALQKPLLALLLLFAHGLAKALLFMSVGSVIATTNCQDLTELGGLGSRMPATTTAYLVAAAGLTGLFPLGCFWCFGLMVDTFRAGHPLLAGVVLLTNALTAFNLVRVFRKVFLGKPHPKTRRSPEVNWLMALPMVSLAVLVLLTPLVIERIDPFLAIPSFSTSSTLLVVGSGLVGVLAGCLVQLDAFWSRSLFRPLGMLQDLLAYDFYTERIYKATIVAFVAGLARLTNSVDRVLVNGLVNRIGSASLASAEGLKLGVSGQLQSYVLTLVAAIIMLLASLAWLKG